MRRGKIAATMNPLEKYGYIPQWLGLVIPFVVFYMQRKKQKARRRKGEPSPEIDWFFILLSFFSAVSFATLLTPKIETSVRTSANMAFFFCTVILIYRARQ